MQHKSLWPNWTQTASLSLIGGSVAWALKLMIIIFTSGRIIDTGAAAFLMKVGTLLLCIGVTSLGSSMTINRNSFLRAVAIIPSPVLVFGTCFLLTTALQPLVKDSST